MKMEIFNRATAGTKKKGPEIPLDERKQDEMDDVVTGISNSLKISGGKAVDNILDSSDEEEDGIVFTDEDENVGWDAGYGGGTTTAVSLAASPNSKLTSPTVIAGSRKKGKNDLETAAIAAAKLCAVPPSMANKLKGGKASAGRVRGGGDNAKGGSDSEDDDDDDDEDDKSDDGSDSGSDYTDDEHEGEAGYKPGGYHPVKVGEVYNQRYVVIKKLGWGHFSTVWMVKDRKVIATGDSLQKNQFFALKVQKSAEHYTDAAMDEVELLDCAASERKQSEASVGLDADDPDGTSAKEIVERAKHVAALHDSFFHTGPNGRHMCMVFSLLGCNLLGLIKAFNYRGIPVPVVKNVVRGICKGLDFLHRKCSIIHTDLKPENVLLQFPNQMSPQDQENMQMRADQENDRKRNPLALSLVELEMALKDPDLTPEERKRLQNRIKKKKQSKGEYVGEDDYDDDGNIEGAISSMSILSDLEMDSLLSPTSDNNVASQDSHARVVRRLPHSAFVVCNFGQQQATSDSKLSRIIQNDVRVSRPTTTDLDAHFQNHKDNGSGIAKIAFILRAYTPEEELADNVSLALGALPWEKGKGAASTREW